MTALWEQIVLLLVYLIFSAVFLIVGFIFGRRYERIRIAKQLLEQQYVEEDWCSEKNKL